MLAYRVREHNKTSQISQRIVSTNTSIISNIIFHGTLPRDDEQSHFSLYTVPQIKSLVQVAVESY